MQETAPVEDAGSSVIEMVEPLAGFPEQRRFTLDRIDDDGLVCHLSSLDEPGLRFVVVAPGPFFPDYAPVIDESVVAELEVETAEDLLALLVVTVSDRLEDATANLLAPILVNHRNRRAGQYLLADVDLPLRAPLTGAAGDPSPGP